MKKLSIINKVLIIVGTIVLLSGINLHVGYSTLQHDHQQMILWMMLHIIAACILLVVVGFHVFFNKWWFKTLKLKIKTKKSAFPENLYAISRIIIFSSAYHRFDDAMWVVSSS